MCYEVQRTTALLIRAISTVLYTVTLLHVRDTAGGGHALELAFSARSRGW